MKNGTTFVTRWSGFAIYVYSALVQVCNFHDSQEAFLWNEYTLMVDIPVNWFCHSLWLYLLVTIKTVSF